MRNVSKKTNKPSNVDKLERKQKKKNRKKNTHHINKNMFLLQREREKKSN